MSLLLLFGGAVPGPSAPGGPPPSGAIGGRRIPFIAGGRIGAAVAVSGPFLFQQTLAAAMVEITSFQRATGKLVRGSLIGTPLFVKGTGKSLSTITLKAANFNRQAGKLFGAAMLATAAVTKAMTLGRVLAASAIMSASRALAVYKNMAVKVLFTPVVSRLNQLIRTLSAAVVGIPAVNKLMTLSRTLAAGDIFSANINRLIAKRVAAAALFTPVVNKLMTLMRNINAAALFTPLITRVTSAAQLFLQTMAAMMITEARFVKAISLTNISAHLIESAQVIKGIGKSFAATIIEIPGMLKGIGKSIAAQAIETPLISRLLSFVRTLAAQTIDAAIISRAITGGAQLFAQTISATLIEMPVIMRGISKSFAATCIEAAVISKGLFKTLSAKVTEIPVLTKLMTLMRTLSGTALFMPAISRAVIFLRTINAAAIFKTALARSSNIALLFTQALAAVSIESATIMKGVSKRVSATMIETANIARSIAKLLAAKMAAIVNLQRFIFKSFNAALLFKAIIISQMAFFRTLATAVLFTPSISRAISAAQQYAQAIAAVLIEQAVLARQAILARRLNATDVFTPAITATQTLLRALAAKAIMIGTLVRGQFRTIGTTMLATAVMIRGKAVTQFVAAAVMMTPALSKLMSLMRTLAGAVVSVPAIQWAVGTIGTSASLAWQRVTMFMRSQGLMRRTSSTTEPHDAGITRNNRRTSISKRGDDDEDIK